MADKKSLIPRLIVSSPDQVFFTYQPEATSTPLGKSISEEESLDSSEKLEETIVCTANSTSFLEEFHTPKTVAQIVQGISLNEEFHTPKIENTPVNFRNCTRISCERKLNEAEEKIQHLERKLIEEITEKEIRLTERNQAISQLREAQSRINELLEEKIQDMGKLREAQSKINELEKFLKEEMDEKEDIPGERTTSEEKTIKKAKKQYTFKPTLASKQRELFIKSKNNKKKAN